MKLQRTAAQFVITPRSPIGYTFYLTNWDLGYMGRCERIFRLPLCETDDAKLARMKQTPAELGLV